MKKLLENKWFFGLTILIAGLAIGWLIKPSNHPIIESSNHQHIESSEYTCSMHPQIRQNEPGSCPICGMDLIQLENDNSDGLDPMAIAMSPTAMQLANVSTAVVGAESAVKTIRLNGKVQEDERLIFSQTTHFTGRIEELSVNFTGEYVSKGSKVAMLYSPQMVTAQEELFEAYKIRESQPNLYRAAREKLKNWKLSEEQIDEVLVSGKVKNQFPVLADQSGYVLNKKVNLGDYVNRGQTIYEITNLSRVWVQFDVYENDLTWIKKGDSVKFTISSLPGQNFKGKIDYIDPVINPKTRVTMARVVFKNRDMQLKPEMFASGEIRASLDKQGDQLTVPKSAIMWTGKRSVVYVKLQSDQGMHFKLREVTLGPALGDAYVVEQGLETGEEIAVNGTFSIDAAAQLAGKPSMMNPSGGKISTGHNHGNMEMQGEIEDHSQHQQPNHPEVNMTDERFEVSGTFKEQLKSIYELYLPVKDALIATDAQQAQQFAEPLLSAIDNVDMSLVTGEAHNAWMADLAVLTTTVKMIANNPDVEAKRSALSPLSDQLYHTLTKYQVETGGYRQFCPMAFNNKGAFWLSDSEKVLNPYFGDVMLTCGNVEEELK
ncbi:MAG: efflux RND transporter periplasmic adaptor subunit [Cyclobacteriaceae bacterium]